MAKTGNRNWFPVENAHITTSQLGFEIISHASTNVNAYTEYEVNGDEIIVAIHNISANNVDVQAQSIKDENISTDDLSTTGAYRPAVSAGYLTLYPEDLIYGKFIRVALEKPSGGTDYLRLIKGVK